MKKLILISALQIMIFQFFAYAAHAGICTIDNLYDYKYKLSFLIDLQARHPADENVIPDGFDKSPRGPAPVLSFKYFPKSPDNREAGLVVYIHFKGKQYWASFAIDKKGAVSVGTVYSNPGMSPDPGQAIHQAISTDLPLVKQCIVSNDGYIVLAKGDDEDLMRGERIP